MHRCVTHCIADSAILAFPFAVCRMHYGRAEGSGQKVFLPGASSTGLTATVRLDCTSRAVAIMIIDGSMQLPRLGNGNSSNATERSGDATTGGELTYIATDVYNRSEAHYFDCGVDVYSFACTHTRAS